MPYYLIGSAAHGDYLVELYQLADAPVAEVELKVMDEVLVTGRDNDPFGTHLRGELQLLVLDKNNALRDRFKNQPSDQFYLTSNDPALKFVGYPITDFQGGQFWKTYNLRTFIFSDGISTLRTQANTYEDYIQLGDFLYQVLNDIPGVDYNLNIVMDYQHQNAAGQSDIIPQQLRILPPHFVHNYHNPTKHDALMAVLEYFKLQVWQQNGEWWIVQRDIRDLTPTRYTRDLIGWTATLFSEEIDILQSDLRAPETKDMESPAYAKYIRKIQQKSYEFETNDPEFIQWTSGVPDHWPGTGNVSEVVGGGILFEDDLPVRTQIIRRIIRSGDVLHLKIDTEILLKDGLTPDSVLAVGIAQIRAVNFKPAPFQPEYYFDGSVWQQTEHQLTTAIVLEPVSYTKDREYSIDVDLPIIPGGATEVGHTFDGYIEITLQITGDDAIDTIQYNIVNVSEVELADEVSEATITAEVTDAQLGNVESDSVYANDSLLYSYEPSLQYYDGTTWQNVSDWSIDADDQSINEEVISKWLKQRATVQRGYQLQLKDDHTVQLTQRVTLSDIDAGVKFVPNVIRRYRKEKRTVVQLFELTKSDGISVRVDIS